MSLLFSNLAGEYTLNTKMFKIVDVNENDILLSNRNKILSFIEGNVLIKKFTTKWERNKWKEQAYNTYIPLLKQSPKVHKKSKTTKNMNALKFRPIVAVGINAQTSLMQKYLCTHLFYIMVYAMKVTKTSNICYNSAEVQLLLTNIVSKTMIFVHGYDFVEYYNSIDPNNEKHGLRYIGQDYGWKNDYIKHIIDLINLIIEISFVKFGDKICKQTFGLLMGNCDAPRAAQITALGMELYHLKTIKLFDIFSTYIDDNFNLSLVSNEYHKEIPKMYAGAFDCTHEGKMDGSYTEFLDNEISVIYDPIDELFKVHTQLKRKSISKNTILHYKANLPLQMKKAMIEEEMDRIMRANSTYEGFKKQKAEYCERLIERGYPKWFIRKCKHPNYGNRIQRLTQLKNNKEKKYDSIIRLIRKKGYIDEMAFKHELLKFEIEEKENVKKDGTMDSYFGNRKNTNTKKKRKSRLCVFKHTYEMRFDGDNANELRGYFKRYKNGLPRCIDKDSIMMAIKGKRKIRQLL